MRNLRLFFGALAVTTLVGASLVLAAPQASAAPTAQNLFVTGPGPGGGPRVRLFKEDNTATSTDFFAYAQSFTGGVDVAMGDLDGDGEPEIITAAGPGGGPHVRVFDIHGAPMDALGFMAYDPNFHGGVHLGVADLDGDGADEVITAPGAGGGPHVRAWAFDEQGAFVVAETMAYAPSFSGGVYVTGIDAGPGNIDGIVTSAGPGGGPHVKLFSPTLASSTGFMAYDPGYTGGVSVAAVDLNSDGTDEIITGSLGNAGHIRSFSTAGAASGGVSFQSYPSPGNTGVQVATFHKAGASSPIIAGSFAEGLGKATTFTKEGAAAPAGFQPYGGGWLGGIRVAGANGLFEDVANTPLAISTSSLPGGVVGTAYSAPLAATGGKSPYTWSISSGALPAGLTLAPTTGLISGTPTEVGSTPFTVKVIDSSATPQSVTKELTIPITSGLSITTTTLPEGTTGSPYSATLVAAGGTTPYTWTVDSGTLPAGLILNPSTGVISGTPTAVGTSNFTLKAMDSSGPPQSITKAVSIKVVAPLTITSSSPRPDGVVGDAYSTTIAASGGTGPYAFTIDSGTLPAGLTLNGTTGVISGTPTAAGTPNFTIKVTDSSAPAKTATKTFSISIYDPLVITTTTLPNGKVNTAYGPVAIAQTGGKSPLSWSISSGTLPAGLAINPTTGAISGTPTAAGASTFTVKAIDSSSPAQQDTQAFTLTVDP